MPNLDTPGDWSEANWKNDTPGNYQNHIGEIGDDIMIWVYGDCGRFGVKVGTGSRISENRHVASGIETEQQAKLKAIEFMQNYSSKQDVLNYINP